MKVYAHYKGKEKTGDGNSYRWRTLLQFGDSWECIGSVFMKNPGSVHQLYYESAAVVVTLVLLWQYLESKSKSKVTEAIQKLM